MKTTHLFSLLLTLTLLLGIAPTARTIEPLNRLNAADATERLPFDPAVRVPAERQGRLFSAIGVPSSPTMVQSPTNDWHIEWVDRPKRIYYMHNRSLRLDAEGHPHIAYGYDHLYYAWHDGTEWHYETVDESPGVSRYASLALDGAGRPHISYSSGGLRYAWHDGTTWQIETVDSQGGGYSSLTLDGAGHPHVSYYDYTNDDLKYAWHDGTTWHVETVDSVGSVDTYGMQDTSLALDGAGHPHIIYIYCTGEYPNRNLKYARHDGTNWHIETVGSMWGESTSLALDGAGHPHISYSNMYAWYDGTNWHIETVDSEGGVYSSLALDGAGRPHISYDNPAMYYNEIKYAWHDGTTWQIETVDSDVGASHNSSSLALDGAGRPHISYLDCTNGDLKYAWYNGTTWQIETADSAGDVGDDTSLALDGAGRPHVSYLDFYRNDLKYAWHDGMTWHVETVDSVGSVDGSWLAQDISLALDGVGRPHISYYDDGANDDLKYAWHDGTTWYTETVDSEGNVGNDTSLALDGAGRPHISYRDRTNDDLKYAWYDGTTWQIVAVDSDGGADSSLVLDETGHPHISYIDDGDLKYAWHGGTTWQIETVDRDGAGYYTSLALDEAGWPHISYTGPLHYDLKYAWHDGTSWHIETVDSYANVGDTSLALDGAGWPHISYTDYLYKDLKYAWHDGTGWQIETVDSVGVEDQWLGTWIGMATSMALDGAGRPHISYTDYTNTDLKYARLMPSLSLDMRATPGDDLDNSEATTYTLTLSGGSLDARLWDPLPPPVRYVSGSITSTLTPPAVYSPTIRAVVWQGMLPLHTAHTVRFQVTQGITGSASLSLLLPIVNTAWLTDTESGDSVSATTIVNGWDIYFPRVMRGN